MVTPTMRRYAAEIYRLQEKRKYVGLSELGEHIPSSTQAISRMIGRLKEGGFLEHELYRGVRLTLNGERIAMPAIRRHRIVEAFLVRVVGFRWDEVHAYSDRFELGVDDLIEERIFEVAGRPERCPHGEPIPTREGIMPELIDRPLVDVPIGEPYRLSRVRIHDPEKLCYLGELGLYPATCLQLQSIAPFHGPLRIKIGREEIVLSHELGQAIYVERGCLQQAPQGV